MWEGFLRPSIGQKILLLGLWLVVSNGESIPTFGGLWLAIQLQLQDRPTNYASGAILCILPSLLLWAHSQFTLNSQNIIELSIVFQVFTVTVLDSHRTEMNVSIYCCLTFFWSDENVKIFKTARRLKSSPSSSRRLLIGQWGMDSVLLLVTHLNTHAPCFAVILQNYEQDWLW